MTKYIKMLALLLGLAAAFTACNKENNNPEKAMQVIISAYNSSANPLMVAIDTAKYSKPADLIKPVSIAELYTVFPYRGSRERLVTITDTVTKKVLYSKPLPLTGSKSNFNFIYIDGKELEVNPPAAAATTNKVGFYVQYTTNDAPIDISLYRVDSQTGQEYRYYLAKNVKPRTWVYLDYLAAENFDSTGGLGSASVCFNKAGTTNQWAFADSEAQSKLQAQTLNLPRKGEIGLVQPYFVVPISSQLRSVRLFFFPGR